MKKYFVSLLILPVLISFLTPADASLIKNVELDKYSLMYGESFQYAITRSQIGGDGGERVKTRIINLSEGTASDWSTITLEGGRHTAVTGKIEGAPFDKKGNYAIELKYREKDGSRFVAYRDFQLLDDAPTMEGISHLMSPNEQRYAGSDLHDIKCNDGLKLVKKSTLLMPACVKPESMTKLVVWGWAKPIGNQD